MKALALSLVLVLSSAVLLADDHTVLFDEDVDFSTFKTFRIGGGRMKSERPELKFPAVLTTITDAIRKGLTARSLKEVSDHPDLMADFSVTGKDFAIGMFGRPNVVSGGRGRGGRPNGGVVDFTEATLVVDLKEVRTDTLIWRGVYHDTEEDAQKLAEALPKDAAKLVETYPPRKR